MCWEDPRIDRQLLSLDQDSQVVVLTSAGCNALDYLLNASAAMHAVDVNPRQNTLMQLKLALIGYGDFGNLENMFRRGSHPRFRELYQTVRPRLPAYAAAFWDRKIAYFDTANRKKSFYYHLREPCPQIWLIQEQYPGGVIGYMSNKLRHVLTEVLICDNYFWRAYLTGSHIERCCPNYLREENFAHLRAHLARVHTYDTTVSRQVGQQPVIAGPYYSRTLIRLG